MEKLDKKLAMCSLPLSMRPFYRIFTEEESRLIFWNRVHKTNTCWNWIGLIDDGGYGIIGLANKLVKTHRISYFLSNGYIDVNLKVLHKCDNPACVNPEHLFQGTQADNVKDMVIKGRNKYIPMYGEKNPMAKATWKIVEEIRKEKDNGASRKYLCSKFNLSPMAIHRIIKKETWK